jgi:hypothetical protein
MPTIIKGTKHTDGFRFNQDQAVREALDRGEITYVLNKMGVYFRPILDGDTLRYEALPKDPTRG